MNIPAGCNRTVKNDGARYPAADTGHGMTDSRSTPRLRTICVALTAVAMLSGCGAMGWAAQIFKPKTPAVYRLPDRPTLVMVDDPQRHLDQPVFVRIMGEQVGRQLLNEHAVTQLVPMKKIDALMAKVGGDFDHLGIDQVGKAVGAEQVVHIHVDSVTLYPQPSLLQPSGVVLVKVIDVVNRRRLFPAHSGRIDDGKEGEVSPRGFKVKVEFLPRGSADEDDATRRKIMNQLVLRLGRDCARLFHEYMTREPGQKFE